MEVIAPDKIWAQSCKSWDGVRDWDSGDWGHQPESDGEVQYTRTDLATEAERTAWNAAIEAAADIFRWNESDIHPVKRRHIRELILAFRR